MEKVERKLRKQEILAGTWVKLGDGELWCVPALPLGKQGDVVLDKLEALQRTQEEKLPEKLEEIQAHSRKLVGAASEFCFVLLKVNYPGLERQYFDDAALVTMQHLGLFQRVVQGATQLGEIIGEPEPGEVSQAAAQ